MSTANHRPGVRAYNAHLNGKEEPCDDCVEAYEQKCKRDDDKNLEDILREDDKRAALADKLVFTNAADVEPQPVEWVWQDRLPLGTLSLAAGAGGAGKSVHIVWAAAQLTRGTLPGCFHGKPKRILWATQEASPEKEVVPRLIAAGADLTMVDFVKVESTFAGMRSDHIRIIGYKSTDEALRQHIKKYDVGMVVLDPLLDVLGSLNSREQEEVRAAVGEVNAFAEETDTLVLGIAHFNKMTSVDSAIDRITGSAAFSQRVRAALVYAYNTENDTYVVSQGKNNWGRTHTLPHLAFRLAEVVVERNVRTVRVKWGDDSDFSVDDLLGKKHKKDGETKQAQAEKFIRNLLTDRTKLCRSEVMQLCSVGGFTEYTTKAAAKAIGVIPTDCLHRKASRADNAAKDWELPASPF